MPREAIKYEVAEEDGTLVVSNREGYLVMPFQKYPSTISPSSQSIWYNGNRVVAEKLLRTHGAVKILVSDYEHVGNGCVVKIDQKRQRVS